MGANQLVKYAAKHNENCKLHALISISNPYDLTLVGKQLVKKKK